MIYRPLRVLYCLLHCTRILLIIFIYIRNVLHYALGGHMPWGAATLPWEATYPSNYFALGGDYTALGGYLIFNFPNFALGGAYTTLGRVHPTRYPIQHHSSLLLCLSGTLSAPLGGANEADRVQTGLHEFAKKLCSGFEIFKICNTHVPLSLFVNTHSPLSLL